MVRVFGKCWQSCMGWQNWQTVLVKNIELTAGQHSLRLAIDSSYININRNAD